MIWIAYARSGTEPQVVEDICALGIDARVPLKIEPIRRGKQRWAEPVTTALFPNYVFINCTDAQWHQLRGIKNLAATFYPVPARTYERTILPMLDQAAAEYETRKAQIEAGERVSEYQDGDRLMLLAGKLAGTLATFRRLVEAGEYGFPEIVAELPATIGGKPITVRVDPLEAKRVAP
jgi:transcription antitermination factor NusG